MNKKQFFLTASLCIFTFLSLFFVLKKNYTSLPSENWSRPVILKEFDINYDFNKTKSDNVFCEIYNNKFYILISEDDGLNFLVYDMKGNEINSKIIDKNIYFDTLKGNISNGIIEIFSYSINKNKICNYSINSKTFEIENKKEFNFDSDKYKVFIENDHFLCIDENNNFNLFYNDENYSFSLDSSIVPYKVGSLIKNNQLKISILSNNLSGKFIFISNYNILTGEFDNKEIEKIKYFTSSRFINTDIINNNDKYFTYYEIYNDKYRTTYAKFFELDNNDQILISSDTSIEKYDPQIKIGKNNENFNYIILENTHLGYLDISKKDEIFPNIIFHKFNSNDSLTLTNTEYITTRPVFIEGEEFNYLISIEKRENKNFLLLSSNDPYIIDKSIKISKNETKDIIFNTLTTFVPFIYFSLPIIIKILIPIILIMIPIGLIKLNWIENNQKNFLIALIIVHFLSKTYVFFEDIIFNINFHNMTFIFSNNLIITLNYIITSLISLYFLKLMNEKKNDSHLFSRYFKFAIFDIIFFTFIFYPYYFL